jgi:hypothetical protein
VIRRFQFVDDHQDTCDVKRLCRILDVNRSSYYRGLVGRQRRTQDDPTITLTSAVRP